MRGRTLWRLIWAAACLSAVTSSLPAAALPDLKPISLQIPSPLIAPPNPTVRISWGVTNQGATTLLNSQPAWFDGLYVVSNGVSEAQAFSIGPLPVYGFVQQGTTYWGTNDFQLPIKQSGTYSLIFKADPSNVLGESNETNNTLKIDFMYQAAPADLAALALQVPNVVTGPPNPSITVISGVTNQGAGIAFGSWNDTFYLSTNAVLDPQDLYLVSSYEQGPVAVRASYWCTNVVRLPITESGTYYLAFVTDVGNSLFEFSTNNNQVLVPVEFHILPPDLMPIAVDVPRTLTTPPNPIVQIAWGVTNQGSGTAIGFYSWNDVFFLSTNSVLDSSANYLFGWQETGPVDPGGVYWRTNQEQLPVVQSGTYYLFFSANQDSQLFESNTNNNLLIRPITFNIQPPDLAPVVSLIETNMTVPPNPFVDLVWGTTNQGIGAALGNWADVVYFSTDTTVDGSDPYTYSYESGPLSTGGVLWHTNSLQLPVTQSGLAHLIFSVDPNGSVYEPNKSNNVTVVPVNFSVQPADLAPVALNVPTVVTAAPNPTISVNWAVTNLGPGRLLKNPSWSDAIYFSRSGLLDGPQMDLWWHYTNGPMDAHSSYQLTSDLLLPVTTSGTYYLIFETDALDTLMESNEKNNHLVVPIAFNILQPDLVAAKVQAPSQITSPPYPTIDVTLCVTNLGVGRAVGQWFDSLYFSSNGSLNSTNPLLAQTYQTTPMAPGAGYCFTSSVRVPVVKSGTYYLILQTDPFNWLFDSNTNNNVLIQPVSFTIQDPDLAPLAFALPNVITSPPNPNLVFTWAVTNQGVGAAVPYSSWTDRIFVSTNGTFDNTAVPIGDWSQTVSLFSGSVYWQTNSFLVPVVRSGNYTFFLQTDANNSIYESDESNNVALASVRFVIQPPDLKPVGLQLPSTLSGPPNPTLNFAWGVTNQGTGAAIPNIPWRDSLYLSTNAQFDYSAMLITSSWVYNTLNPAEAYWLTNSAILPVRQSGRYYLFLQTDSDNSLFELNESNNIVGGSVEITILPPDLVPVTLQVLSSTDGPANPRLLLAWRVTNQGTGTALGSWNDQITFSKDPYPDYSDVSLVNSYQYGPVEPGASYWQTNSVRVPLTKNGTNYFILQVNNGGSLFESVQTNNLLAIPVLFTVHLPDLAPIALVVPNQIAGPPNPTVTISWGITNQGTGPAIGWDQWYDQLYLSTNAVLDSSANPLGNVPLPEAGPISAGHTYWRTRTIPLPLSASGKYYLFLRANTTETLPESNLSNNVISASIDFKVNPPDLAPIAFGAPTNLASQPNPTVTLFWGVTNQGIGAAQASATHWFDQVYLSNDDQLDLNDTPVTATDESGPVPPGAAYWRTNIVRLPLTQSGSYYLIFKTDGTDILPESQESNNIVVVPISYKLELPDLAPISLQAPAFVTGSTYSSLKLIWGVTNQGKGTASSDQSWQDAVFVTNDPLGIGPQATSVYQQRSVAPGTSYWTTNWISLPTTVSGDYYLVLKVDSIGSLPESNEDNNTTAIPIHFDIVQPDLSPISLQVLSVREGLTGDLVTLAWGVTNQGASAAAGQSWSENLWLSPTSTVSGLSTSLGSWWESGPLPPGSSYWRTNVVKAPLSQGGEFYLIFTVNPGLAGESITTNNSISVKVSLDTKSADLAPIALNAPTKLSAAPYPLIQVVWGVTNQGAGFAFPGPYWDQWHDALFLSTNSNLDGFAQQLGLWPETNAVAPGDVYWRTNLVQLPLTQSGHYFLIFDANLYGLGESNQNNNFFSLPLDFTVQFPDLAVLSWQSPTQIVGQPWPTLMFVAGITNRGQGPVAGSPTWQDSIYLSQTPFFDTQARLLSWWTRSNTVPAGGVYWLTNHLTIPAFDSADYYLFFVTDEYNSLGEQIVSNNMVMSALSLDLSPPADLTVDSFQLPTLIIGTSEPTVSVVSHVLNQGLGPAVGQWSDSVSLAGKGVFGYPGPTRNVLTNQESISLLPGEGYWRTNSIQMPEMQSGRYQLTFWTDVSATLYESDRDNNTAVVNVDFNLTSPSSPRLGPGVLQPGGQFVVSVYGSFGNQFLFQVSTDLQNWQTLYSFYCTDTPTYLNDWQTGSLTSRFYRIVAP